MNKLIATSLFLLTATQASASLYNPQPGKSGCFGRDYPGQKISSVRVQLARHAEAEYSGALYENIAITVPGKSGELTNAGQVFTYSQQAVGPRAQLDQYLASTDGDGGDYEITPIQSAHGKDGIQVNITKYLEVTHGHYGQATFSDQVLKPGQNKTIFWLYRLPANECPKPFEQK
jgi:hypothetical protein